MHDAKANEMDKKASAKLMLQKSAGGKSTYRKSTIHQSEPKNKGCGRELPLDKFGINNGYIRSFCKDCNNKYHREYRHSFLHR